VSNFSKRVIIKRFGVRLASAGNALLFANPAKFLGASAQVPIASVNCQHCSQGNGSPNCQRSFARRRECGKQVPRRKANLTRKRFAPVKAETRVARLIGSKVL
jgi:hypothetical protein